MHLILRLRGGGSLEKTREMSIAAGGKIKQVIFEDYYGDEWLSNKMTVFNVQMLNSVFYKYVTGNSLPSKPMDAKTYAEHGMPFFKIYEESSGISGDFSMVKSVAQIANSKEENVDPIVRHIGETGTFVYGILSKLNLIYWHRESWCPIRRHRQSVRTEDSIPHQKRST